MQIPAVWRGFAFIPLIFRIAFVMELLGRRNRAEVVIVDGTVTQDSLVENHRAFCRCKAAGRYR